MTPFILLLFAALVGATPIAAADDCSPKGITEIAVTRSKEVVLATYQLSEAVQCIKLGDRGDVRKLTWALQTDGAHLSDDGNTVRFGSPRKDFVVRLRAFDRDGMMDRVYSPLIAFGDGSAVAVYTAYLRPEMTERGVFISFKGFTPTAPDRDVGPQRIGNEQTYIIVGRPILERRGKVVAVVDQAMPAWLLHKAMADISRGEAALRGLTSDPRPLAYLITYTQSGGAEATWRGDTLDRLVRLNFMGAPWQNDQPDMHGRIAQFILHELFHTASSAALNRHLPGALSLLEGGAEAGAMALRRRFAASAGPSIAGAVDDAISACEGIAGHTLAEKEQKSPQDTPYVCGMALQFMVAGAVRRAPLDIWQRFLRKAEPSQGAWPLFLAAATDGQPPTPALLILDEMTSSQLGWESGIVRLAGAGLLRRMSEAELSVPQHGPTYVQGAIFHLLRENCSASYGYVSVRPAYVLDAPAGTCGLVPDKFRLVAINGLRLDTQAFEAHGELARRCAAYAAVELSDDLGNKFELTCRTPPKPIVLYSLPPSA